MIGVLKMQIQYSKNIEYVSSFYQVNMTKLVETKCSNIFELNNIRKHFSWTQWINKAAQTQWTLNYLHFSPHFWFLLMKETKKYAENNNILFIQYVKGKWYKCS